MNAPWQRVGGKGGRGVGGTLTKVFSRKNGNLGGDRKWEPGGVGGNLVCSFFGGGGGGGGGGWGGGGDRGGGGGGGCGGGSVGFLGFANVAVVSLPRGGHFVCSFGGVGGVGVWG